MDRRRVRAGGSKERFDLQGGRLGRGGSRNAGKTAVLPKANRFLRHATSRDMILPSRRTSVTIALAEDAATCPREPSAYPCRRYSSAVFRSPNVKWRLAKAMLPANLHKRHPGLKLLQSASALRFAEPAQSSGGTRLSIGSVDGRLVLWPEPGMTHALFIAWHLSRPALRRKAVHKIGPRPKGAPPAGLPSRP